MSIAKRALGLVGVLCLFAGSAVAQIGRIRGTVRDESRAVIAGAEVIAETVTGGPPMETMTNDRGAYEFPRLVPGEYTLTARSAGFKETVRTVSLAAGQTLSLDFVLQVGPVTEVIEVSAGAPSLQTETSSVSGGRRWRLRRTRVVQAPARSFSVPGYANREQYDSIRENGFHNPRREPLSTFSVDVDTASYANVRRFLHDGQLPPPDAVRVEELVNYFDYEYPAPTGDDPVSITIEASVCPWQPKHQLVHIGLRARPVATADLPPANLVFLLDVSGSMNQPNKLPLLKKGFQLLAGQLRPQDQVSIVVYAGAAGQVLPPTSGRQSRRMLRALDRLESGGSTAGGAGIQLAYQVARENFLRKGNNRVILATDGDFNVGVSDDAALVRLIEHERESGVFLSVLGFGQGNLQDSKMEKLADRGNGNYSYIDSLFEARRTFVEQLGATIYTVAKDVKAQVEFNPARVAAYRLVGYENRLLADEDFNDDIKDAGDMGAGHTVTAFYEVVPAGVEPPRPAVDRLRYQPAEPEPASAAGHAAELLTLKVRYKEPDGKRSRLLERPLANEVDPVAEASANLRWGASVAMFGMLLRDSPYVAEASWEQAVDLADGARGRDRDGRQAECLHLMRAAEALKGDAKDRISSNR